MRPLSNGWSGFPAIEESPEFDYSLVATDDARLQRYPDLVARLHWTNSSNFMTNSSFHIAALLRSLGREDVAEPRATITD
jgi:hypothetical protein